MLQHLCPGSRRPLLRLCHPCACSSTFLPSHDLTFSRSAGCTPYARINGKNVTRHKGGRGRTEPCRRLGPLLSCTEPPDRAAMTHMIVRHVEPTIGLDHKFDHVANRCLAPHIGPNEARFTPLTSDLLDPDMPPCASISTTTTRAPRSAKRRADARPIPEPAPVTRAVRPSSIFICALHVILLHRQGSADCASTSPSVQTGGPERCVRRPRQCRMRELPRASPNAS